MAGNLFYVQSSAASFLSLWVPSLSLFLLAPYIMEQEGGQLQAKPHAQTSRALAPALRLAQFHPFKDQPILRWNWKWE